MTGKPADTAGQGAQDDPAADPRRTPPPLPAGLRPPRAAPDPAAGEWPRADPDATGDSAPRGPYDPDPDDPADDPWFMPAPDIHDAHDTQDPDDGTGGMPAWAMPGPRAAARPHGDPADWAGAEARHAARLARAALALGALDDRVRQDRRRHPADTGPAGPGPHPDRADPHAPHAAAPAGGLRRRILCAEIADLAWHLGDRVTPDRLALYLVLRLPGAGDDAQALARAAWAFRRLDRDAPPPLDDATALAAYLGRAPGTGGDPADPLLIARPTGTEFDALARDWAASVAAESGRHPLVQAAAAWHGWRGRGLSGDAAEIEGAVLAARIAARALRPGGLGFVPLGLGGGTALRTGGDTDARLAAWLGGIEGAALRGLMDCDRLAAWEAQATARTAPMSGRTPTRLIAALTAWPIVSAPMLTAQTGASRAAVQRNMIRFEDMGLVRELTGQTRFRFWRAAL